MTTIITLTADAISQINLSAAQTILEPWLHEKTLAPHEQSLRFEFAYQRDPSDPREWSELPEVRLWFVRLDARYPWLPWFLDWEFGELARYAAMLVPHQFSPREGIQYNPEALEIFMMSKVFVLLDWLPQHGLFSQIKLKFMTQLLGYELDDEFFKLF